MKRYVALSRDWPRLLRLGCVGLALCLNRVQAGIPEPDLVWYGRLVAVAGDAAVRVTSGTLTWQIEPVNGGAPWVLSTPLTNINDQFSFALRVPCESLEPAVPASAATVTLATPAVAYRRVTVLLDGQPIPVPAALASFSPTLADRGRAERIDLVLGTLPADTDGDGLADSWELLHFGSLTTAPGDDPDHDGVSNLNEYRAGTDPRDAASRFELIEIQRLPEGTYLRWASQANRRYKVRRASSILAPLSSYQVLQSGLAATPPFNEFIDTTAPAGATFFYLLQLED